MNVAWVLEWWVKMQTNQWHYDILIHEDDAIKKEIHLLLMLDNMRDAMWHRLDISFEDEQHIEGVIESG